ncbi:hypothetical protein F5H01DRAFT_412965 [Linnemannia elongata]|nr:hypothetical protein F5H01DRAFT_412965 [Linnemannia elongata]
MSLTQLSQHLFIAGFEDSTQCFQRYGQPLSQLCYALVETGPDGAQFVLWSKIQELYDREGKVKFVVDDNDLVPLAVGPDMQIIVPWRIQAFLDKILQVALNDEQPGCLDLKTPADIHPIATTDYSAESGSSFSSSCQSKPSDAGSTSSSSSSPTVFMTGDTKQYTATSSSPSLALPPPVATAARSRSTTAVSSDDAGPSPSTWPAIVTTGEASFFSPHTRLNVAQDDKNAFPLLSPSTRPQELAQGKAEHALGELDRSPPLPSLSPYRCFRCRHRTRVDGPENFIQVFAPSTPTHVSWLHEPTHPAICMDCSPSFQEVPTYSAAKAKSVIDDNSDSDSDNITDHNSSSSSNPTPSSIAVSFHRRAITYPVTRSLNQPLLLASQIAEGFSQLSCPQPASRRSASMQAPSPYRQKLNEEPTLFLDDELLPFFN